MEVGLEEASTQSYDVSLRYEMAPEATFPLWPI